MKSLRAGAQEASAHHGPHALSPLAASAPGASHAQVEVVKEGDKIVRLIITCVCGERTEIECLYPPGR
ncbi:hypothetical protein [Opitutus sp. ER46]|uniref:hypothetical protein n=1 Tax=Opitutus sp. ER46 TaxID=2161864 RepID=UPI0011B20F0E|nr:hypothetical protein [Opitutus sp. ER46]